MSETQDRVEAGVPGAEILVEAKDTLGDGTPAGAQEDYR